MNESQDTLKREFQDEEYRYAYAEDFLNTSIAMQIRVLREQRNGMTQQELADKIGTKQAGVSRLENVNYSAWKTQTLKKIARALGVRLKITFETFGSFLGEAEDFSRKSLQRPDFADDPAFAELAPAALGSAAMSQQSSDTTRRLGQIPFEYANNLLQMPNPEKRGAAQATTPAPAAVPA